MTDAGQELIANALAGSGEVAFTSVKTSSYAYPDGTNISGLTDLQDIVQTVDPFSAQVFNETMLQVSARFDNSQVQEAYLIQTLGVYAQVGSGSPVLFAVVQADTPDQMPAQSAVSPSAFIYNIQTTVQQATSLIVSVNPAGTATVQDILNLDAAKVDKNGGDLVDTVTTFDDSGSVSGITSFPAFLATFLSNTKTGIFLRNLKAGLQYVLHVGSIVNDCVTNNPSLPLSAAQGKVLMDGKAPNNHASGATTYGLGNAGQYGHVKLSDAYTSSAGNAAAGMGASSYALAQAYSVLNTKLSGKADKGAIAYADINSISDSGLYNATNPAGTILHIRWDDNYSFQLLHLYTEKIIKFRSSSSGTWSQWFTLSTTQTDTVILSEGMTLYRTSNMVTVCVNRVRSMNLVKDTLYTLSETIPSGYRPLTKIAIPIMFRTDNILSPNGDGVMIFDTNGSISFCSSFDRSSSAPLEINGCVAWVIS